MMPSGDNTVLHWQCHCFSFFHIILHCCTLLNIVFYIVFTLFLNVLHYSTLLNVEHGSSVDLWCLQLTGSGFPPTDNNGDHIENFGLSLAHIRMNEEIKIFFHFASTWQQWEVMKVAAVLRCTTYIVRSYHE